ncbi:MAG: hypothetical protein WB783_15590 [Arenicellales bacterium]
MLREISGVRQEPGRAVKQWFSDEAMDLFVWRDSQGGVEKFQLAFKVAGEEGAGRERALTWSAATGFLQHRVDDGEQRPDRYKATPILVPSVDAPPEDLSSTFIDRSAELDPDVRVFVAGKLDELRASSGT